MIQLNIRHFGLWKFLILWRGLGQKYFVLSHHGGIFGKSYTMDGTSTGLRALVKHP